MIQSNPIQRRTLLIGSAGCFAALGGCASVIGQLRDSPDQRPPPLQEVVFENYYDENKPLELVVERNGDIVHWETYKVPRLGPKEDGGWKGKAVRIDGEPWMGCGHYEVNARLVDELDWGTLDFGTLDSAENRDGKFVPLEIELKVSPDYDYVAFEVNRLDGSPVTCEETTTESR
jgi:hypothetical protein